MAERINKTALNDLEDFIWDEDFTEDLKDLSGPSKVPDQRWNTPERQTLSTEMMKGLVSSGFMDIPEEMAKEAVRLADALLDELNK